MGRGICRLCQKFFIKTEKDQEVCPECYEKDSNEYRVVKDYLFKNSRASIMDVYLDTKVPVKTLKRYIEEGRIRIIDK